MSQSSPDSTQAIQPVPIIRIEAEVPGLRKPPEEDADFSPHGVEHHGFACGAADVSTPPGVPWDLRPLSQRGILAWTIAAMSGLVALVTTVAVARSHPASTVTPLHGREANVAASAAPVANLPPITATETHAPPVIPLEALPIDKPSPRHAMNTSNRARTARSTPASIAVKKTAPTQRMLRQRTTGAR